MNLPDPQFLHCCRLDGEGGCQEVEPRSENLRPGEGLLWVHFNTAEPSALQWLAHESGVTKVVANALSAPESRPRSFTAANGVFAVLRGVNLNPGANAEDMVSIRVWLEPGRIITSRRRRLLSVQDMRDALESGQGPETAGEFLTSLIERLADRIGNFVDQIEDQLEDIDIDLGAQANLSNRQRLGVLRRQIAAVRRFLAPQRDALERLYHQPSPLLSEPDVQCLREEIDRLARYVEDLDLAKERAIVLQEELLAQLAHEQNARMYVLSVAAAIFLPLTFVTGLLGMNVGGLPGSESSVGFLVSLAIMGVISLLLVLFLKWKKWI
jgi:zinc transporter